MRIQKRILRSDRVRHPPREGFSWIDRRFMHRFAPDLHREAVFLYLFLSAVSDKSGLSYYKDETIAERIGMETRCLCRSRQELVHRDLIAYEPPLYQVLSLPLRKAATGIPVRIGDLLRSLAEAPDNKEGSR
jgi:hypothetical protein